MPESLVKAVIRQSGGWQSFKEIAGDVARHGASAGFGGWIYHPETCEFARENRKLIAEFCQSTAEDFGVGTLEMIQGFNCIGTDYSLDDIGRCLYGSGEEVTVLNGLAWFALEEVCRTYSDAVGEV